ncbi:helix-turn-helix domain-containing protein [Methylobacterium sp. WL69]|nr:helix-turn-helix domain-containing protein [Methylobacterium sp. WL69]
MGCLAIPSEWSIFRLSPHRKVQMNTRPVLPPRAAADMLGISLSTLNRLRLSGRLPPPIRLSERRIAWRLADLETFLSDRTTA